MEHIADPKTVRAEIRAGRFTGRTKGHGAAFVQANLVVVPREVAFDFLLFIQRNPKPCPLLEVVEAGSAEPRRTAPGADLRTDLPRYRVWRDGVLTEEPTDVTHLWRDDLVSFLLGCSYTFEQVLADAGLGAPYNARYISSIPCRPVGRLTGPMVVTMRPYRAAEALRAAMVTAEFPEGHGAPVHQGDPAAIGIDLAQPDDNGNIVPPLADGEVPVFWACGVTPQAVLLEAKLPFAITHAPAHMFVTDVRAYELKNFRESVR